MHDVHRGRAALYAACVATLVVGAAAAGRPLLADEQVRTRSCKPTVHGSGAGRRVDHDQQHVLVRFLSGGLVLGWVGFQTLTTAPPRGGVGGQSGEGGCWHFVSRAGRASTTLLT